MKKIININRNYMVHAWESIAKNANQDTEFRIWGDLGGIWISDSYPCSESFLAVRVRADGDHRGYTGHITAGQCGNIIQGYHRDKQICLQRGTNWLPTVEPQDTGGTVWRNFLCNSIRKVFWEILQGLGSNTEVAIAPWGILATNGKMKYIHPLFLPHTFEPFYLPWPCWTLLADKYRIEKSVFQWIMPEREEGRWAIVADDFVLSAKLRTVSMSDLKKFPKRAISYKTFYGNKIHHGTTPDGISYSMGAYGQFQA